MHVCLFIRRQPPCPVKHCASFCQFYCDLTYTYKPIAEWKLIIFPLLSGTESNFKITNPSFVTTQGVEYDIGSLMHYSARAFSTNGQPTIEPRDPAIPLSTLGQRNGLSARDLQHVTTLYCGGKSIDYCRLL